jgi:hypothetical protein
MGSDVARASPPPRKNIERYPWKILEQVVRRLDSAIHRIVIFSTLAL